MSGPDARNRNDSTSITAHEKAGDGFDTIPTPTPEAGRRALRALLKERSILAALSIFHEELGDVFRISLGSFSPIFMVGPEASRFVLISARHQLLWRPHDDPVTKLLRNGLLVTDGETHDELRRRIMPALHRKMLGGYVETMWRDTDEVTASWPGAAGAVDMLVEMRRIALLIVMDTLFRVDFRPDIERLFPVILDTLRYISPGLWTVWPRLPRFGYKRSLQQFDAYLYQIIADRRRSAGGGDDLLSLWVNTPCMSDDLIRDQILTLLIAGHDTSTALLAWTLYLLGSYPDVARRLRAEVDTVLSDGVPTLESVAHLTYLDQVINETMRLYPPIHIGNRMAATDLSFKGYQIPAGTRVVYSIYLTHRHRAYWPSPDQFDPGRFSAEANKKRAPYTYLPFGGGPRNCIGAAFAQVEAKVVLSRIIQRYDFRLDDTRVHPHMGATLEPRPGVPMHVRYRN
jgi:cytochrome P450